MKCGVCWRKLRSSYSLPCGHSLCCRCTLSILKLRQSCPFCRFKVRRVAPNYSLRDVLQLKTWQRDNRADRQIQRLLLLRSSSSRRRDKLASDRAASVTHGQTLQAGLQLRDYLELTVVAIFSVSFIVLCHYTSKLFR